MNRRELIKYSIASVPVLSLPSYNLLADISKPDYDFSYNLNHSNFKCFVLSHKDNSIISFKTKEVLGSIDVTLKPNTWYKLDKNNSFIEWV